jgi:multidrug efflux system outer membrane protein
LFFPQVSLNASGGPAWGHSTFVGSNGASRAGASVPGGIGSGAFSTIAAPPFIWTYVISALQPIFEGGYLRSNLRFARSEERQALISYEQTVLHAFGDVSDALFAYEKYHGVRERQEQTVKDLKETVDVSLMQYRGGTANYINVLDSQRSLFQAELTLAQARNNEYQSLVQLYKALGGGWK